MKNLYKLIQKEKAIHKNSNLVMSKPNRNNKNEQDNNKRPMESNDGNAALVSTPQKKALDVFRAKILTTPEKIYTRKYGVLLTKVIEDRIVVGVSIEGAYLAKSYLLGQMNSTYLMYLACQSNKKLDLLPIRGKYWKEDSVMSLLTPPLNIPHVDYLVSKTTKEKGNGAVLLFTALQLLEIDADKDFGVEVNEYGIKLSTGSMTLMISL